MSDKSKRGEGTRGVERRAYPVQLEIRAGSKAGTSTIEGYASVFDSPYEMYDYYGSYQEVVRPGAFTKTLAETPQVQLLLNHGGLSMAYTQAGTLRLAEDSTGLHMQADINAARSDVADMLLAITDGNVDEMSFAFRCVRQMWSPDYDQRDLLENDIHRGDVSVVNYGASPATSVSAARAQDWTGTEDDARALYERLSHRFDQRVPDTTPEAPAPSGMPLGLALALVDVQG